MMLVEPYAICIQRLFCKSLIPLIRFVGNDTPIWINAKKVSRLNESKQPTVAGAEGLEPSTKVLETHVLPLHHAPLEDKC